MIFYNYHNHLYFYNRIKNNYNHIKNIYNFFIITKTKIIFYITKCKNNLLNFHK